MSTIKQKSIIRAFQIKIIFYKFQQNSQVDQHMPNNPIIAQSDPQNQQNSQQYPSQPKYNSGIQFNKANQLVDYFKSIKTTSLSQKKSDFYTYERYTNVVQQIYNGQTQLSPKPQNINPLLVRERLNFQQQKTNQLKNKKAEILQQLSFLDDQVSKTKRQKSHSKDKIIHSLDVSRNFFNANSQESDPLQEKINKKLILSKQEHKHLIIKVVKQRQERQKNRFIMKEKQQQKFKKLQEQQKIIQIKRIEEQKKKKTEQIQEKLRKKKQIHQKFIEEEKQSLKKVQQLKQKKFLYQQISEKFESHVKMPLLQEQKKILRQRRQFAKAYSIDQIKNHQKSYMELRQSSMKKSEARQNLKSQSESYKVPPKIQRLEKFLEEEKLEQRKKLMQKKRVMEQKLQRRENYVEYLKENFSKVKVDKNKQEEVRARIEGTKVKRQEVDQRSIGLNYLQEAKKLRRKSARSLNKIQKQEASIGQNKGNITVLSQQQKRQKLVSQSRVADDIRQHKLIKKRQQKIQVLINDKSIDERERIKKLKMETEKINEAFKMKEEMLKYGHNQKVEDEALELLLASIQAKMGIIDIGKEKEKMQEKMKEKEGVSA